MASAVHLMSQKELSNVVHDSRPEFSIGTFSIAGGPPFGGVLSGDRVIALRALLASDEAGQGVDPHVDDVLGLLECWDRCFPRLRRALESVRSASENGARFPAPWVSVDALRVHAPLIPRQLFCTGANYRGHVAGLLRNDPTMRPPGSEGESPEALAQRVEQELDQRAVRSKPYIFTKLPAAIAGPFDELVLPRGVEKPDWELELAAVIGRRCRRVSAGEAMRHVAGYAILNDVTARELVFRRDGSGIGADWLAAKSQLGFAPFGPYIVPAPFIDDVYDLQIQLSVNGKLMQDETTRDMLIDIARQIEHLSSITELLPGDVISTGSPAGNGSMHGVFLKPGDVMEGTITGLGKQSVRCVAES